MGAPAGLETKNWRFNGNNRRRKIKFLGGFKKNLKVGVGKLRHRMNYTGLVQY